MSKTLVVVESPAKAKTIKKYLGAGFEVLASKGHVKDLPKKLGVDVERGFKETYEIIAAKAKVLAELKSHAKSADRLLLATDPDREGEAIAWHIMEELKRPKLEVARVEFHEITKKGVQRGLESPRALDQNLYDAQRARRVLDRIVGYDVSALVWSKLAFGLSAGRVQSVALRLIVDREREIEAFVPVEYWNVGVALRGKAPGSVFARLARADGESGGDVTAADPARPGERQVSCGCDFRREQKRAPRLHHEQAPAGCDDLRFAAAHDERRAALYEGVDLKKDGGPVGHHSTCNRRRARLRDDRRRAEHRSAPTETGTCQEANFFKATERAQAHSHPSDQHGAHAGL
jgi:DNA topoisomerase-1